jgi:hypothetical protein
MASKRKTARSKDWKQWKTGWRYKTDAPRDKQWQEDRLKLFRENGNGWWCFVRCGKPVDNYE